MSPRASPLTLMKVQKLIVGHRGQTFEAKQTDTNSGQLDGKNTAAETAPVARPTGSGQTPKSDAALADAMMAGVMPGPEKKPADYKLLPPTTWGRYVKILLSSGEFLYVD